MLKLLVAYKTEINPTPEQIDKLKRTIGTCRFVYNLFIATNKERYECGKPYMSGYEFSKYLNHEYLKENPDKIWIKEVSSKAVKQSIMNAHRAFMGFFKGQSGYPKFKKKSINEPSMYFVNAGLYIERHRMKIPTIGWVKLKEFGYIPTDQHVSSGHVTYLAGRYYVSVLVDMDEPVKSVLSSTGIGIDLGVKELATVSDGKVFSNINKTKQVKKLEKSLKRQQRRLSRKYESFKKRTKRKKGVATRQNIRKQALKVAKLYHRMERIREDYENKVIIELVKTKPAYIALEDLNIRGMMKNRHLSKAIASQRFYSFQTKLMRKAKILGIEIRMVDRWYPSSKMCHTCGCVKKDLKLKDRIYQCDHCGMVLDRDFNAALNIRDANQYVVA